MNPLDATTARRQANIRADLLVRVLRNYQTTGTWPARPQRPGGQTFYIMHPVLRHIAILKTGKASGGWGPSLAGSAEILPAGVAE